MILEWMNDPPHGRIGTALVDEAGRYLLEQDMRDAEDR
jgi:hypothetical protein